MWTEPAADPDHVVLIFYFRLFYKFSFQYFDSICNLWRTRVVYRIVSYFYFDSESVTYSAIFRYFIGLFSGTWFLVEILYLRSTSALNWPFKETVTLVRSALLDWFNLERSIFREKDIRRPKGDVVLCASTKKVISDRMRK